MKIFRPVLQIYKKILMAFSRKQRNANPVIVKQKAVINRRKPGYNGFLARQKGFEPPTPALGGRCSVQLSYWRVCNFYSFL